MRPSLQRPPSCRSRAWLKSTGCRSGGRAGTSGLDEGRPVIAAAGASVMVEPRAVVQTPAGATRSTTSPKGWVRQRRSSIGTSVLGRWAGLEGLLPGGVGRPSGCAVLAGRVYRGRAAGPHAPAPYGSARRQVDSDMSPAGRACPVCSPSRRSGYPVVAVRFLVGMMPCCSTSLLADHRRDLQTLQERGVFTTGCWYYRLSRPVRAMKSPPRCRPARWPRDRSPGSGRGRPRSSSGVDRTSQPA